MKVTFIPQNIEIEVTPEKSLLQIATENKIEIRSLCKGVPSCAECRVRLVQGEDLVLPPTKAELGLIGTTYTIDGRRLACQVHCFGNVTVDLSEQIERQEKHKKKIRGFKSDRQVESTAVVDTMILTEKPEDKPGSEARRPEAKRPESKRPERNADAKRPERNPDKRRGRR